MTANRITLSEFAATAAAALGTMGGRLWVLGKLRSGAIAAEADALFEENQWAGIVGRLRATATLDAAFWHPDWTHDGDRQEDRSRPNHTMITTYSSDWRTSSFAMVWARGGIQRIFTGARRASSVTLNRKDAAHFLSDLVPSRLTARRRGRPPNPEKAAFLSYVEERFASDPEAFRDETGRIVKARLIALAAEFFHGAEYHNRTISHWLDDLRESEVFRAFAMWQK